MNTRKLAASIIGTTTVLGAAYFWVGGFDQGPGAYELYATGSYTQARERLQKDKQLTRAEQSLYQAYIARETGQVLRSNQLLQEALASLERDNTSARNHDLAQEVTINILLNDYLAGSYDLLAHHLKASEAIEPTGNWKPWFSFFRALLAYQQSQFAEALEAMDDVSMQKTPSPWLTSALAKTFTDSWKTLVEARSYIKTGKTIQARRLIENETAEKGIDNQWLKALSYLQEAEGKDMIVAVPYYRLAFSFLEDVPLNDPSYRAQREELVKKFYDMAMESVGKDDKNENVAFLVHALQTWGAEEQVTKIAKEALDDASLVAALDGIDAAHTKIDALKTLLETEFEKQLLSYVENDLHENNLMQLMYHWELGSKVLNNPSYFTRQISQKMEQVVLAFLMQASAAPTEASAQEIVNQGGAWLTFLKDVTDSGEKRRLIAMGMIPSVLELLATPGRESVAISLSRKILNLPQKQDRPQVKEVLASEIKNAFLGAFSAQNIEKMTQLFDVSEELELEAIPRYQATQVANYIADVEYLISSKQYQEARRQLEWILKLKPNNQAALRLMGTCLFFLEDYKETIVVLERLYRLSPKLQELLAISYLQESRSDDAMALLEPLQAQGVIGDRTMFEIGMNAAEKDDFDVAALWFSRIRNKSDLVLSYLTYCSYDLERWSKCVEYYQELPENFKKTPGMAGLAIKALLKQGKFKLAEDLLDKSLKASNGFTPLPDNFTAFKDRFLDDNSLLLAAGDYYLNVEDNPEKAWSYLEKLPSDKFEHIKQKAEALTATGRYDEAQRLLAQYLKTEPTETGALTTLLAKTLKEKGQVNDALDLMEAYFHQNEDNVSQRLPYARLLADAGLWQDAYKELSTITSKRQLEFNDRCLMVEALTYQGQQFQATETAKPLFNTRDYGLQDQLKIAKATKNLLLGSERTPVVPNYENLFVSTLALRAELIHYMLDIAEFDHARNIAKDFETQLAEHPAGILALIRMEMQKRNSTAAQRYVSNAFRMGTLSPKQTQELLRNAFVLAKSEFEIKELLNRAKEAWKATPNWQTTQNYVESLITTFEKLKEPYNPADYTAQYLVEAKNLLQEEFKQERLFPHTFMLMAKTASLMGYTQEAEDLLAQAIRLHPGYANAYCLLGELQITNTEKALGILKKAAQFEPTNPKILTAYGSIQLQAYEEDPNNHEALKKAEASFVLANRYDPHHELPYIGMGKILMAQNNFEGALKSLRIAREIVPENKATLILTRQCLQALLEESQYRSLSTIRSKWQQELNNLEQQSSQGY